MSDTDRETKKEYIKNYSYKKIVESFNKLCLRIKKCLT